MTADRCPSCDRIDCEWHALPPRYTGGTPDRAIALQYAAALEDCEARAVDWRARALKAEAIVADAFDIGYDAGWEDTGEGHNGEYCRSSFTAEKYRAARAEAREKFLRLRVTGKDSP